MSDTFVKQKKATMKIDQKEAAILIQRTVRNWLSMHKD